MWLNSIVIVDLFSCFVECFSKFTYDQVVNGKYHEIEKGHNKHKTETQMIFCHFCQCRRFAAQQTDKRHKSAANGQEMWQFASKPLNLEIKIAE